MWFGTSSRCNARIFSARCGRASLHAVAAGGSPLVAPSTVAVFAKGGAGYGVFATSTAAPAVHTMASGTGVYSVGRDIGVVGFSGSGVGGRFTSIAGSGVVASSGGTGRAAVQASGTTRASGIVASSDMAKSVVGIAQTRTARPTMRIGLLQALRCAHPYLTPGVSWAQATML